MSISTLDKFGYTCTYGNRKVSIEYEDNIMGTRSLLQDNNLYCYSIQLNFIYKHERQETSVI